MAGVHVWLGACMVGGGCAWQGGMCGKGAYIVGACMAGGAHEGGMCGGGACMAGGAWVAQNDRRM